MGRGSARPRRAPSGRDAIREEEAEEREVREEALLVWRAIGAAGTKAFMVGNLNWRGMRWL